MAEVKAVLTLDTSKGTVSLKQFSGTAEKEMKKTGKAAKDAGDTLQQSFKKSTIAAGALIAKFTVSAVGSIQQVVQSIKDNSLAYKQNAALVQNLGADIDTVKARISALDPVLGKQQDLLESYFSVYSGGVTDTEASLGLLENAAKLAFAENANLTDVVKAGTKIWNIYGSELESTAQVFDILSATAQIGDTNLQAIAGSISRVLPFSKALGVSLEETSGILAILTQVSGSTEMAVTNLSSLFRSFTKDTADSIATAKQLGIDWGANAVEAKGLMGVVEDLRGAIIRQGLSQGETAEAITNLTGRAEAAQALLPLLGDSFDKVAGSIDQVSASAGMVTEKFENMEEAIGPIQRFENEWNNLTIALGENFLPVFESAVTFILELTTALKPAIDLIAKLVGAFLAVIKPLVDYIEWGWNLIGMLTMASDEFVRASQVIEQDYIAALGNAKKALSDLTTEEIKQIEVSMKAREENLKKQINIYEDIIAIIRAGGSVAGKTSEEIIDKYEALKVSLQNVQRETSAYREKIVALGGAKGALDTLVAGFRAVFLTSEDAKDSANAWFVSILPMITRAAKTMQSYKKTVKEVHNEFEDLDDVSDIFESVKDANLEAAKATEDWSKDIANLGVVAHETFKALDFGGPDELPARFRSIAKDAVAAFSEGFQQNWRNLGDVWTALGVGLGDAITAGIQQSLRKYFETDDLENYLKTRFGGIMGSILSAGIPVIGSTLGNLASSAFSAIGGLFGFGGDDEAEKQKQLQKQQEAAQMFADETTRMTQALDDAIKKIIRGAMEWDSALEDMANTIKQRGGDLTGSVKRIVSAIDEQKSAIESAKDAIATLPGAIQQAIIQIDNLRRGMQPLRRGVKEATLSFRDALRQMRRQFPVAGEVGGPGTGAGIGGGNTGILRQIREAQEEGTKAGMHITLGEQRKILEGINDPLLKTAIKQLITAENAWADQKMQIKAAREMRLDQERTLNTLKHNLPLMKERLKELKDIKLILKSGFADVTGAIGSSGGGSGGSVSTPEKTGNVTVSSPEVAEPATAQTSINVVINSDNADSFRKYINSGDGKREISDAVKEVISTAA